MSFAQSPWITRFKILENPRIRLLCFPYAGGGASMFRLWHEGLLPDVEVCAVQLPGREVRMGERPMDSLPTLIGAVDAALLPLLDAPIALFGHSMGAVLAFEYARALRRRGITPAHLVVSARGAPRLPPAEHPLHALPDAAFIDAMVRRYNGIPPAILNEPELQRLLLPVLRADMMLIESYVYAQEGPLSCPITVLGGRRDPGVSEDALRAWCAETRAEFHLEMFPGAHFFLNTLRPSVLSVVRRHLVGG